MVIIFPTLRDEYLTKYPNICPPFQMRDLASAGVINVY
jgi:hypothetical protein